MVMLPCPRLRQESTGSQGSIARTLPQKEKTKPATSWVALSTSVNVAISPIASVPSASAPVGDHTGHDGLVAVDGKQVMQPLARPQTPGVLW